MLSSNGMGAALITWIFESTAFSSEQRDIYLYHYSRYFKESDHVVGTTFTAADLSLITNLQNLRFVKLDLESIAPRIKALETALKATPEFQQVHAQFDEVVAKLLEGK